jgi:hypothetical protein
MVRFEFYLFNSFYQFYSMIKRYLFFFLAALSFYSCDSNENRKTDVDISDDQLFDTDFEAWVRRQVEAKLQIPATENYTLTIHREYIDRDTLIDAVILLNRREFARQKALADNDTTFEAMVGFTGPYNHVFTHVGGTKSIHQAPPVGSSADYPLTVFFEKISNPAQLDFYVEYRVRTSVNRNYYTIYNGKVQLIFSCPLYDFMDPENPVIYKIKHLDSEVRLSKDIALYNSKILGYDQTKISNFYTYYPEAIEDSEDLYVYFVFDQRSRKYVTPMRPE